MHRIGLGIRSGFTFHVSRITFHVFLSLCSLTPLAADIQGLPLNDYTRLGQRFTATLLLSGVWIIAPSWLDAEGGFTLTLWDSPQRTKRLAEQTFSDIPDNARLELWLPRPVPPGAYYWEIHDRTGQTKVGLYVETLEAETEDCAYFDGEPDRKRRFSSGPLYYAGFRYTETGEMIAALKSDAPLEEKDAACRQLAIVGGREAVPALAGLLADETLSCRARHALERMPDPAADDALRAALSQLHGRRLVGVINSLGVRRDTQAVPALTKLLQDSDPEVASAAAVALGRIGTVDAARALEKAEGRASPAVRPALYEGLLNCAEALAAQGRRDRARAIYDRLRGPQMPAAVRLAALRGALLARQPQGLPLLLEQLHSPDAGVVNVALWMLQRELPGAEVTQAVAAELDRLPPERQVQVIRALGGRGDPAALPALLALLKGGEKGVRLAVLQALPQVSGNPKSARLRLRRRGFGHVVQTSVVSALIEALGEPDGEISQAARACLGKLPGPAVETAVTALLDRPEKGHRLAGIELLGQRSAKEALPALLKAARDPELEVRLAALQGLEERAGPAEVPALLDLLAAAPTPPDLDGAERALGAACAKTDDPEGCAERLVEALARARTGEVKQALLRVLVSLGGSQALQSVRAAVRDPDAEVRATAIRLLSEWKTTDAAPDLLELAQTSTNPADRWLCLRGYMGLAGNKDVPIDQRLAICQQAATLIQRDEEKKLLLSLLGTIPTPEALALARPYLDDPATREEASAAALSIAEQLLSGGDTSILVEPLQKVARDSANADLAQRAQALLEQLEGQK